MFIAVAKITSYYNNNEVVDYITLSNIHNFKEAAEIIDNQWGNDAETIEITLLDGPVPYLTKEEYNRLKEGGNEIVINK